MCHSSIVSQGGVRRGVARGPRSWRSLRPAVRKAAGAQQLVSFLRHGPCGVFPTPLGAACRSVHQAQRRSRACPCSSASPRRYACCLSCPWSSLLFFVCLFALRRRIPQPQPSGCGAHPLPRRQCRHRLHGWRSKPSPTAPICPFAHSPKTTTPCCRCSWSSRPDCGLLYHDTVNPRRVNLITSSLIAPKACRRLVEQPFPKTLCVLFELFVVVAAVLRARLRSAPSYRRRIATHTSCKGHRDMAQVRCLRGPTNEKQKARRATPQGGGNRD